MQTIDDIFNSLKNKTIINVDSDYYDNRHYLVFLLSNGSIAYISSADSLYIAIEDHVIN